VIDVGKRGVSACWQHAGSDPVIAPELSSRDDAHFEVHRTFHVDDVQAQEERPGRFEVVARQPLVKLSQQLVAGSQHPAEWCHYPDAYVRLLGTLLHSRRLNDLHRHLLSWGRLVPLALSG
jgi:hypothetical protein